MRKRQVSFSGEVESVLKRKYNTPDPPVQKVKEKKSKPPSDQAYRPMLKNLGLKIKRDFSGNNQNLEDPEFMLSLITKHSEQIQSKFNGWTKTERSVYKTYFNELIKGAPGLGNTLVDKTKDF